MNEKPLCLPILVALVLLAALAPVSPARGAMPGALDPSFGDHGRVVAPLNVGFDSSTSAPVGVAKLEHGATVVLAANSLLAFKRDGRPNRAFGGGRVEIAAPVGTSLQLVDVAADRQGRILVGGTILSAVDPELQQAIHQDEDVFVARFGPDGQLDPSFGQGGVLRSDLGMSPPPPIPTLGGALDGAPPQAKLQGIAVDTAGRVVISGLLLRAVFSCRGTLFYPYRDTFLGRLGADGNLDSSFGQGGIALVPESGGAASPVLTHAGGVYLLDSQDRGCDPQLSRLTRFDVNGAVAQPVVTTDFETSWTSIAIDRRGRVLLAGPENRFGMATVRRILPGGRMDARFGHGGVAHVKTPNGLDFEPSAVRAGTGSEIVVVGTARPSGTAADPRRFMVARLTGSGALDRRFSGDGRVLTRFGRESRATADDVTLVRGGILVTGRLSLPSVPGGEGLALARYLVR